MPIDDVTLCKLILREHYIQYWRTLICSMYCTVATVDLKWGKNVKGKTLLSGFSKDIQNVKLVK